MYEEGIRVVVAWICGCICQSFFWFLYTYDWALLMLLSVFSFLPRSPSPFAEESGKETPKRIFVPPDLLLKNFTDLVCSKLDLEKESCKQLTFFENGDPGDFFLHCFPCRFLSFSPPCVGYSSSLCLKLPCDSPLPPLSGVESEILPAQLENTMQHAGKLEYKLLIAEGEKVLMLAMHPLPCFQWWWWCVCISVSHVPCVLAADSLNRGGASSDFGGYFFSEFTVSQYVVSVVSSRFPSPC